MPSVVPGEECPALQNTGQNVVKKMHNKQGNRGMEKNVTNVDGNFRSVMCQDLLKAEPGNIYKNSQNK